MHTAGTQAPGTRGSPAPGGLFRWCGGAELAAVPPSLSLAFPFPGSPFLAIPFPGNARDERQGRRANEPGKPPHR